MQSGCFGGVRVFGAAAKCRRTGSRAHARVARVPPLRGSVGFWGLTPGLRPGLSYAVPPGLEARYSTLSLGDLKHATLCFTRGLGAR